MAIKKTLWLTDNRGDAYRGYIGEGRRGSRNDFSVRKMKNTTKYKIGQFLSKEEANTLLTHRTWYSWEIIVEGK